MDDREPIHARHTQLCPSIDEGQLQNDQWLPEAQFHLADQSHLRHKYVLAWGAIPHTHTCTIHTHIYVYIYYIYIHIYIYRPPTLVCCFFYVLWKTSRWCLCFPAIINHHYEGLSLSILYLCVGMKGRDSSHQRICRFHGRDTLNLGYEYMNMQIHAMNTWACNR